MDYRRYSVMASERKPLVDFMLGALEDSGCTILKHTPANEAPFRITFETPTGERSGLLAYAFFANSKITKNRPEDEWRFQVKYGSRTGEPQPIWFDENGLYTTIFLGINPEHGVFVGADPTMHNPTKFFISVEFKQEHVAAITHRGWHAWERKSRGDDDEPVEVLVGGSRRHFLSYVKFERAAFRLDQGNRQLLAEQWLNGPAIAVPKPLVTDVGPAALHALAREFEMSDAQILDMIASARRLKMAVRGWVAEEHLVKRLSQVPGVTDCVRLDIEGGADVRLRFDGSRPIEIQCKNVLRDRLADGTVRLDFQKTRVSKGDRCTRYYRRDEFDLIAACLHAVTEQWEFVYALPQELDAHDECPGRLNHRVRLDQRWNANAQNMLAKVAA